MIENQEAIANIPQARLVERIEPSGRMTSSTSAVRVPSSFTSDVTSREANSDISDIGRILLDATTRETGRLFLFTINRSSDR